MVSSSDQSRTITFVAARKPAALRLRWSDGTRRSRWPQPNESAVLVHLAHAVGEVAERSDAGEGAWGVAHALSRRFAPTSPTSWARCTACAHRHSPQPAKISEVSSALSLSSAGEALGLSRRMVAYYSSGEKKVPRAILLACKGWEVSEAA
jgi:hypothetical protein